MTPEKSFNVWDFNFRHFGKVKAINANTAVQVAKQVFPRCIAPIVRKVA